MNKLLLITILSLLNLSHSYAQNDFTPSYSPNGKKIAFYRYVDKVPELMIINSDGTNLTQLTSKTGLWSIGPSWSKNGKEIYFSQGENMGSMDVATIQFRSRKVNRIKKEGMQFTVGEFGNSFYWTAKNKAVFDFYKSPNSDLKTANKLEVEGFSNYWLMPLGSDLIIISKDSGNEGVFLKKGSEVVKIVAHSKVQNLSISSDQKFLLFESEIEKNTDIYMVKINGGNLTRLTTDESADYMPSFSPNNDTIVFVSARSGKFCLYKKDLQSGIIKQLTGIN